jgi:hypothetical protein
MTLYLLQFDGTNYNRSSPLQLYTNQLQLDHLIAARREPIATRVSPVATEEKSIAIKVGCILYIAFTKVNYRKTLYVCLCVCVCNVVY